MKSWYVCDAVATRPDLMSDLIRHVASTAHDRGIEFCNLIASPNDSWLEIVRDDHLSAFAPRFEYRLMARRADGKPVPALQRVLVDPLDI